MSIIAKATLIAFAAAMLSACGQQEEPAPLPPVVVEPEPTYSKF